MSHVFFLRFDWFIALLALFDWADAIALLPWVPEITDTGNRAGKTSGTQGIASVLFLL